MQHTTLPKIGIDPISVVASKLPVNDLKNFANTATIFQDSVHQEALRRLGSTGLNWKKYKNYNASRQALVEQDKLEKMLWRPVAAGGGGFALVVTDETVADNVQTASKKKESDQN